MASICHFFIKQLWGHIMDVNQVSPSVSSVAQQVTSGKELKKVDVKTESGINGRLESQNKVNDSLKAKPEDESKQPALIRDTDEIDQAVLKMSDFFQDEQRKLSFSFKKEIGDVVIEVRDFKTDELVRQIPSELIVKIAEHLEELEADSEKLGMFLQEKV